MSDTREPGAGGNPQHRGTARPPHHDPDPGCTVPVDPGAPDSGSTRILGRRRDRRTGTPRYRLVGEVARGGMGAILEVWDEDLRRHLPMRVVIDADGGSSGATADAVGIDHADTQRGVGQLVELYEKSGREAEAAARRAKSK